MDYSKFSDENFDAIDWVNTALASAKDDNIDQHAVSLVMKLQMFIQEVNNVVDDTCQQVVLGLPRIIKELEVVTQEASLLKDQMKFVKNEIEKVERDTAQSMHTIYKLDSVKNRMKLASDALREVDNWTTLISDANEVVDSNDITEIANKIVRMKQSLNTLSDVIDYTDRCNYLERLKDKFEAVASSSIIATLSSQSHEELKFYVNIFTQVDRLNHLYKYYISYHRQKLVDSWTTNLEENRSENVVDSISTLYNNVAISCISQLKICGHIFPDPVVISCTLITEAFNLMSLQIINLFDEYIDQEKNQPMIINLIYLRKLIDQSLTHLDSYFENHSFTQEESIHFMKMLKSFYFPFQRYLNNYSQLEQEYLIDYLKNLKLSNRDLDESVNLMASSVSRIFLMCSDTIDRCIKLSSGVSFYGCIQAIMAFLKDYIIELKRLYINISERFKANMYNSVDETEWSSFQNCLRIVQICGDAFNNLDELNQNLISKSIEIIDAHNNISEMKNYNYGKISNVYLYLLDQQEEILKLKKIVNLIDDKDVSQILQPVKDDLKELCQSVNQFSYDTVFSPLQVLLSTIHKLNVWESEVSGSAISSKLPLYSLSPQEYITKIAQYLLTLPQQLDSFTLGNDILLRSAMKHGRLPYISDSVVLPQHLADVWLESVTKGLMNMYTEEILKIRRLNEAGVGQLLVDIEYLMNVLDDVGLKPSEAIDSIFALLKLEEQDYHSIASNHPQRLSSTIAKMRGISNVIS